MKLRPARRLGVVVLALALTAAALPAGKPEEVGLSSELRTDLENAVMQAIIE